MKTLFNGILATIALILFISCGNEPSLQKYYVEKQKDNSFITLDVPTSLIVKNENNFTPDQNEALESIKKVNVVALKRNEQNLTFYDVEKEQVHTILNNEKYKTLMKYGSNSKGATLKFTGEVDAIDEIIVFASDDEKGFALFRVLGDDMEPAKMMQLMDSLGSGSYDFSFLQNLDAALN